MVERSHVQYSDVFQGERGGTPSPLFYKGNGVTSAKIKRGERRSPWVWQGLTMS
jgi:hypothetical protein